MAGAEAKGRDDGRPLFGAHAFIWAADWDPQSAERVIAGAAAAGLDFVEISLLRPLEMDVPGTRALLERHEMACTASLGLPREANLTAAPEAAEQFLRQAVDVTAALGSPVLTGCLYTNIGTLTGAPPTRRELDLVVEVIARVAGYASERGIALGLEPVNRYETHLLNLATDGVALLDAIGAPDVFLHLDTYHMNIEEKGFYDPIVAAGDRLGYIHLSESDRGTPGTGNVHWHDVFRGLAAIGYGGRLVMESFAAVNDDIIGATAMWRNVVGDPEALVRDGLAFLRTQAREHGLAVAGSA